MTTPINRLKRLLIIHATELHACTGPVPRHVVDEMLEAVIAVLRDHDVDAILGPMLAVVEMTQAAIDSATAEVLALADTWDGDDDEPDDELSAFRQWQQDVTA